MNKFIVFAALVACALASSSSSSTAPVVPSSSSSSDVPVFSSSSSSSVPPVMSSSSSSSVPVPPVVSSSSSSVAPIVSSSSAVPENKTFTPTIPCELNFTLENDGAVQDYWGYINEKTVILMTVGGDTYMVVRCDLPDDKGNCYVQSNIEGNDTCNSSYTSVAEIVETMIDPIFFSVVYNTAEYPVTVDCPDGAKDCQKYCRDADFCLIADKDDKLVAFESDGKIASTITYRDGVDASTFVMKKCDNSTDLDAPVNPCGAAPSGSSTKGSSSGSASVVEVAYAVVLAALLVALF